MLDILPDDLIIKIICIVGTTIPINRKMNFISNCNYVRKKLLMQKINNIKELLDDNNILDDDYQDSIYNQDSENENEDDLQDHLSVYSYDNSIDSDEFLDWNEELSNDYITKHRDIFYTDLGSKCSKLKNINLQNELKLIRTPPDSTTLFIIDIVNNNNANNDFSESTITLLNNCYCFFLELGTYFNNISIVKSILDLNSHNNENRIDLITDGYEFFTAAKLGNNEILQLYVQDEYYELNDVINSYKVAIMEEQIDVINIFLNNQYFDIFFESALMFCVLIRNTNIVKLMLQDNDIIVSESAQILSLAIKNNDFDMIKVLVDYNFPISNHQIIECKKNGNLDICNFLIDKLKQCFQEF